MLIAVLWRAALFAAIWWSWTGADLQGWIVGGPSVAVATAVSVQNRPLARRSWSPLGVMVLIPFFIWKSVAGGVDVAWRVMLPGRWIQPGFATYRLGLAEGPARWFYAHLFSLMPGTLSARLEGDTLLVHALNLGPGLHVQLVQAERWVARALRVTAGRPGDEKDAFVILKDGDAHGV